MNYVPKPDIENVNAPASEPLKDAVILLFGFVAVAGSLLLLLALLGEYVLTKISLESEVRLFSAVTWAESFKSQESRELEMIATRLMADSPVKLRFSVVCGKVPNAFAFPGGRIVVTSALIKEVKSETGLAFVLAHEIGHVMHRHHVRGLGYQLGLVLGAALLGIDLQSISGGLLNTAMGRFHVQANEHDADLFAIENMKKTYGHLDGAAEFFEIRLEEEPKWKHRLPSLLETHPATPERIQLIKEAANSAPAGEAESVAHQVQIDCPADD